MNLETRLSEKSSAILDRWLQLTLETYPADTQRFLKKQKDPFANPIRDTISREINNIYKALIQGVDRERVSPCLDRIIRIRAVQDFSPSQAISFVLLLKKVIREVLVKEIREGRLFDELLIIESRIDDLSLLAFDIYMKRREKLYEIKANQAKNQVSKLLERAGLICEIPQWQPDLKEDNG